MCVLADGGSSGGCGEDRDLRGKGESEGGKMKMEAGKGLRGIISYLRFSDRLL